jgi:GWxTD domain-containing protein
LKEQWRNHASAEVDRSDAFGVDIIHFSVAPGRYRLSVDVEDSVSGKVNSTVVDVEGFLSAPSASDLVLSPQIRFATGTDTVPQPSELRWGRMLVTAAAQLELTPLRPRAYYLLEAYSRQSTSGTLELAVRDSAGKAVVRTAPSKVWVEAGGGVLRGELDLTGLPSGNYSMRAVLNLGRDSIERSASFLMRPVGETLERDVARRAANRITDEGYFASMSGDSLTAAAEALAIIATASELKGWSKSLSLRAKRNFMARFWAERDPTPGTPRNEARETFYQKLEFANETYRTAGRRLIPGWRTDRGRVYLRNGQPDDVLRQGAHGAGGRLQSRAVPYEVWRYTTSGKDRYYIFTDRTGLGAFSLIRSNDLTENGLANWNEFFSGEDMDEIQRFLGREILR